MAIEDSIDVKDEFNEATFESKSNDIAQQNEEIFQTEITSKAMFFETPIFIKIEDQEENWDNSILVDTDRNMEKEENAHICLICGLNTTNTEFSREKWMANENWRKECAETICDMLLTSDSHFNQFFQIAQYCPSCLKLILEADFTRRRIISLQITIKKLSISLRRKFALNFIQLKASQQHGNNISKDHHPSTSKNLEFSENLSANDVVQRIYTENSSAFELDVHARKDVPLRFFTKSKIADIINSNTNNKTKHAKRKKFNKRWSNVKKPRARKALEKKERPKVLTSKIKIQEKISDCLTLVGDTKIQEHQTNKNINIKTETNENEILLDNSSTAIETNDDYEDDYIGSQNDNLKCEVEKKKNSPEKLNPRVLEEDIVNSQQEGRVVRRQRKPPQRFTFEDTRLTSGELRDDILSDDDEEQPKKSRKVSKQIQEDEEDYVPEEGARTDMEKWWYEKAKERFKRKNPNNFPCPIEGCNQIYKKKYYMQKHIRTVHEGVNYYHCGYCPATFYTQTKLDRHKTTHPEYNITINDPEYVKPIREYEFTCAICGQGYNSEEELTAHNEIHAGPNPFVCCHCKKECTNSSELKSHITMEHDNETPKCNFCGKTFVSNRSLQQHKKIHLNPEDCFKCPDCPFVSPCKVTFKSHVARRHGETEGVQCETCGKTLKDEKNLRKHMLSHTGERPYKCRVCEKSYKTIAHRNRHETIHSGIRPHVCSFCGKASTTADSLRVHELIHTRDPNVPLPKRIYKKPFPKKKKKVKPPIDKETGSSGSSQSQNVVPTLNNGDNSASFSSIVNMSQNAELHSYSPNDSQIEQHNNLQCFSQTQMLENTLSTFPLV